LPFDFVVAGTYKNLPGIPIPATYVYGNAQVVASLGRNLSACLGAAVCTAVGSTELLPAAGSTSGQGDVAASMFDKRLNETDLRLTRVIKINRLRVQGVAELYNVFNQRVAQGIVGTYSQVWQLPFAILGGRLFKFGAQVDF
jgi:hypothetical protein